MTSGGRLSNRIMVRYQRLYGWTGVGLEGGNLSGVEQPVGVESKV